jgi:FkbM family methyltransferase
MTKLTKILSDNKMNLKMDYCNKKFIENIFSVIPKVSNYHSPDHELFILFDNLIKEYFEHTDNDIIDIEPLKGLVWPRITCGNLSSYAYFDMQQAILYMYYYLHRHEYKIAYDIGCHIGGDSIILEKFGYEVYAFEPEKKNFQILENNVQINNCKNMHIYNKAMSDTRGKKKFIRVLGNTFASHIEGERDFYGDVEYSQIETMTFDEVGASPDLMKINIEGHEKVLISCIPVEQWEKTDAFIELHGEESRNAVFSYLKEIDMNIFSQKIGWKKSENINDIPESYREGYIFVSRKSKMIWDL